MAVHFEKFRCSVKIHSPPHLHSVVIGFKIEADMVLSSTLDLRAERGSQLIGDAFDYLIDRNSMLDESNRKLSLANRKLEKQRDDALQQFDIVRKDKERLEQELYSKFVLVLNAKKQKANEFKRQIAQLHERVSVLSSELDAAMQTRGTVAASVTATPAAAVESPPVQSTKRQASISKHAAKPVVKKARNSLAPTPTLPSQLSQLSLPISMAADDIDHDDDDVAANIDKDDDDDSDHNNNNSSNRRRSMVDDNDDDEMPPPPLPLGKSAKKSAGGAGGLRGSQFGLMPTAPPLTATIGDADLLSRSDDSDEAVPLSAGETALHRASPGTHSHANSPGRRSAVRRTVSEKSKNRGDEAAASESSQLRRGSALAKNAQQPQSVPMPNRRSAAPTTTTTTTPQKGRVSGGAAQSNSSRQRRGYVPADSIGASGLLKEASEHD